MKERGLHALAGRMAEIDRSPGPLPDDLYHIIRIMDGVTSSTRRGDVSILPLLKPSTADALQQGSRVLARLASTLPGVVDGPMTAAQYWVVTGPDATTPRSLRFSRPADHRGKLIHVQPHRVGLYTSAGAVGTRGMWQMYLELQGQSTFYPLPWNVWYMQPRPKIQIAEIGSANDWASLVCAHPRRQGDLLYPDWWSIHRAYDAVHIALRAAVAIQGILLHSGGELIAPAYWDIEQTFWMRWCFERVALVERVEMVRYIRSHPRRISPEPGNRPCP